MPIASISPDVSGGPMFNTLHLVFETQCNELALAVDQIAE
jgi:DNA-binding ferritin-like protein